MKTLGHLGTLGIVIAAAGLTGCDIDVIASHEPMHPKDEPTYLRATAEGKVSKVEIWVGYSTVDANGQETVTSPLALVKTCDPDNSPKKLVCRHTLPRLPDFTMVDFKVVAFEPFGDESSERYRFAASAVRFPNQPIPIRAKGNVMESLDVVMIRDTDVPETFFRWQLDDILADTYFRYSTFRDSRNHYNYYYSGEAGHYSDDPSGPPSEWCVFHDPPNIAELLATGDSVLFLHASHQWDCKWNGRASSELWNDKSLIHESGHAFFGLRDEYPVTNPANSPPQPAACAPNLWSDQASCQAAAPGLNLNATDCVRRAPTSTTDLTWIIDPTGPKGCIMAGWQTQWQEGSDYGPACSARAAWRHDKCEAGTCITSPDCP